MINAFRNLIKEAVKEALNETSVSLKVNQSTNNDFKSEDYILKSALKDDYILKSELEENYFKKELFNKLLETFSKSLKEEYILKSTVNNEYVLKSDVEKNYIKRADLKVRNKIYSLDEIKTLIEKVESDLEQTPNRIEHTFINNCLIFELNRNEDIYEKINSLNNQINFVERGNHFDIEIDSEPKFNLWNFTGTRIILTYFYYTGPGNFSRRDLIMNWMNENNIDKIKVKIFIR
jgi:hypothetical protein